MFFINATAYRNSRAIGFAIIFLPMLAYLIYTSGGPKPLAEKTVDGEVYAIEIAHQQDITFYHGYVKMPDEQVLEVVVKTPYKLESGDLLPFSCKVYDGKKKRCTFEKDAWQAAYQLE